MEAANREYCLTAGNEAVCVFIHGIFGSPEQFRSMAESLHRCGVDCITLLLPGHGGTAREFHKTSGDQWSQYIETRLGQISSQYPAMYLIGHSLGGLLSLDYAGNHPVAGVVLINAPLFFRMSIRQLCISMRILLFSPARDDEMTAAYRKANGVKHGTPLETILWSKQFLHLAAIARRTRGRLAKVCARVLIVRSMRDESVGRRSADSLAAGLTHAEVERLDLHDSYHAFFPQQNNQTLIGAIIRFIGR
jgi:carboxylesterase